MKILFLSDNFPPEVNASSSRVFERAKYWVKWGHEVTVITCAPNFPQGKVYPGYKNKWYQTENIEGIRVVRVKTFIAKNEGFLLRIIDFVSYMCMAIFAGLFQKKADVIVATSPQFFCAVAGYVLGVAKRKPFIFELSDLWPASIAAVGSLSKQSKLYKFIEKIELFLYRHASKVIALTYAFKQDLIERGINADKIEVIRNGADLSQFTPIPRNQSLLEQYHLQNQFVIGYIGTHGMAHGLEKVLEVAALIKEEKITFLFIGDGAEKEKLLKIKEEQRLNNVVFIPPQPKKEIAKFWSLCDVALVHLKNDETFSTVIPSKIFEAMALGIPVLLVSPTGEASDIVIKEQIGEFVPAAAQEQFLQAVKKLYAQPELLKQYRENELQAIPRYSREQQARSMIEAFEAVK